MVCEIIPWYGLFVSYKFFCPSLQANVKVITEEIIEKPQS